jgi:hypothetical protein
MEAGQVSGAMGIGTHAPRCRRERKATGVAWVQPRVWGGQSHGCGVQDATRVALALVRHRSGTFRHTPA